MNLWALSAIEHPIVTHKRMKKKQTQIVDMYDPLSIDLGDNE